MFCKEWGTQIPSPKDVDVTETKETPKKELTTGSTFTERYQIIEELGKGGMGKVYRVELLGNLLVEGAMPILEKISMESGDNDLRVRAEETLFKNKKSNWNTVIICAAFGRYSFRNPLC